VRIRPERRTASERLKIRGDMFPARKRRRLDGFSLIELLIVIAIILIILAVALPKLTNARRYA
jgi:prepilin-type N-terminal cleavage/methylation domain-containing protein